MGAFKTAEERCRDKIKALRNQTANSKCCDCGAVATNVVLTNRLGESIGCFVCTTCAGAHRSLGHMAQGITASSFEASDVEILVSNGNANVNAKLEKSYSGHPKRTDREVFIEMKYVKRSFAHEKPAPAPAPTVAAPPVKRPEPTSSSSQSTSSPSASTTQTDFFSMFNKSPQQQQQQQQVISEATVISQPPKAPSTTTPPAQTAPPASNNGNAFNPFGTNYVSTTPQKSVSSEATTVHRPSEGGIDFFSSFKKPATGGTPQTQVTTTAAPVTQQPVLPQTTPVSAMQSLDDLLSGPSTSVDTPAVTEPAYIPTSNKNETTPIVSGFTDFLTEAAPTKPEPSPSSFNFDNMFGSGSQSAPQSSSGPGAAVTPEVTSQSVNLPKKNPFLVHRDPAVELTRQHLYSDDASKRKEDAINALRSTNTSGRRESKTTFDDIFGGNSSQSKNEFDPFSGFGDSTKPAPAARRESSIDDLFGLPSGGTSSTTNNPQSNVFDFGSEAPATNMAVNNPVDADDIFAF